MKQTLIIRDESIRGRAISFIRSLPLDPPHKVQLSEIKDIRSLEQNSKMWAMLTDISRQVIWYGEKLSPEEWKDVITAALKRQKVVPGIEGGFVAIGAKTSKMSVKEMIDVIEFSYAFGAEKNVRWTEPEYRRPE